MIRGEAPARCITGLGSLRSWPRSGVGVADRTTTVATSNGCCCCRARHGTREVRHVAAAAVVGYSRRKLKTQKQVVIVPGMYTDAACCLRKYLVQINVVVINWLDLYTVESAASSPPVSYTHLTLPTIYSV